MASDSEIRTFKNIMGQLESSNGTLLSHPEIQDPKSIHYGTSAIGDVALMPATIKDMAKKDSSIFGGIVNKSTPEELAAILKENPTIYDYYSDELANNVLDKAKGDPTQAAYNWRFGTSGNVDISEVDKKDPNYANRVNKAIEGQSLNKSSIALPALQEALRAKRKSELPISSEIRQPTIQQSKDVPVLKQGTGKELNLFELIKPLSERDPVETMKQQTLLDAETVSPDKKELLKQLAQSYSEGDKKAMTEWAQSPTAGIVTSYKDAEKLLKSKSGKELVKNIFKDIPATMEGLEQAADEIRKVFGFLQKETHSIDGKTPYDLFHNTRSKLDPKDVSKGFKYMGDNEAVDIMKDIKKITPDHEVLTRQEIADKYNIMHRDELTKQVEMLSKKLGIPEHDIRAALTYYDDARGFVAPELNFNADYTGRGKIKLISDKGGEHLLYSPDDIEKLKDISTSTHELGHASDILYSPEFISTPYAEGDRLTGLLRAKTGVSDKLARKTSDHFSNYVNKNAELQNLIDYVEGNPNSWTNLNKLLKGEIPIISSIKKTK